MNLSMGYARSSADSSLIPSTIEVEFAPETHFNDVWFTTMAIYPGYAYTYVHKTGIYGSLGLSPGIGLAYQKATGEVPTDERFNYFLKGIGRGAIGYNNEKWTFGASLTTDVQAINFKDIQFRNNNLNMSIFVGYRIKTKFMAGKESIFDFSKKKKETEQ